jgi:ribonuclease T1
VAFAFLRSVVSKFALTGLVLAALSTGAQGFEWPGREASGSAKQQQSTIALTELPTEGRRTYNRERLLPRESRGHYREYTVETPGARNRGARRIVCGGERVAPAACWYSADHYASFRRIVP